MTAVLARADLGRLFDVLRTDGWEVIGPTVRDGAIVQAPLSGPGDLPEGWTSEQSPGRYRLVRRSDDALFGYAVGPQSPRRELLPSRETLSSSSGGASTPVVTSAKRALLGVRACELAAIGIQDRVFLGAHTEPRYAARRADLLLIAVQCGEPSGVCFCVSMGTGPRVTSGADLVMTELGDRFTVEAHTEAGRAVLDRLPTRRADPVDEAAADTVLTRAEARMGRAVDPADLPGVLFASLDAPRWDEVGARCLSCGNCTSVCPTCFCSSVEEVSDLDATRTERVRTWDSCFTGAHSTIHGAVFRPTTRDRYRQWLTHKFGSWVSQFGTSGCVGCGRCIAWCPAGIDVTEELSAIRAQGAQPVPIPEAASIEAPGPVLDLVPVRATVLDAVRETGDVVTLRVEAPSLPRPGHGQFHMVGLPGIGEVPISVSAVDGRSHSHTIRAVGAVTRALCALSPGDDVEIRGPYGTTWPVELVRGRPAVIVAGGLGIAPLRTAIRALLDDPAVPEVRVFYGARTPEDALYVHEQLAWARRAGASVEVTVDRAGADWVGHVGVVTRLLRPETVPREAVAFVCGPEVMMRFALDALHALGIPPERRYLSVERHMKCAAGFCGRCQYAHWFVCKDGPVFRNDVIAPVFGVEGF